MKAISGLIVRVFIYVGIIMLGHSIDIISVLLLLVASLLILKIWEVVGGVVLIWRYGESLKGEFSYFEATNKPFHDKQISRRETLKEYVLRRFKEQEPFLLPFGTHYRKLEVRCDENSSWWRKKARGLSNWFRDSFLRFNMLGVFSSMTLLGLVQVPDSGSGIISYLVGGCLLILSSAMGIEILVGNALMGDGYSRYFHLEFLRHPKPLSAGMKRLYELKHFSKLVIVTLTSVAACCSAFYLRNAGFAGVSCQVHEESWWCAFVSRIQLWVDFFYFATTTFSTVGFGDIHPETALARALVTFIHFLTFGYVLFLLQTIMGRCEEDT